MSNYRSTIRVEKVGDDIVEAETRDQIPERMNARLGNGYYMTNLVDITRLNDAGTFRVVYEARKVETKNVEATSREECIEAVGQILPDGRSVAEILQVKELQTKDKDVEYLKDVEEEEDEEVESVDLTEEDEGEDDEIGL